MAKTWHYSVNGVAAPPVDEKTFVEHCQQGKIRDETMVWTPGMSAWQSFAELRAMEESAAAAIARKVAAAKAEAEAAAQIQRHVCPTCKKEWPEILMVQVDRRWICRPCHIKALEAARKKAEDEANKPKLFYLDKRFIASVVVGCAILYFGGTALYKKLEERWNAPPSEPPEQWALLPTAQWPQLVRVSSVQLRGGPQGWPIANGSLVVGPHSHVLGLGFSRGLASADPANVHPARVADGSAANAKPVPVKAAPPDQLLRWLNTSLVEWRFDSPPPAAITAFTHIREQPPEDAKSEVLVMDPAQPIADSAPLPTTALHMRKLAIAKGLKIYVVSSTPATEGVKQNVLTGSIRGLFDAHKLLDLEMAAYVDPATLVGAPVLDENGHLLGIVSGTMDSVERKGTINTLLAESLASFAKPIDPAVVASVVGSPAPGKGK